QTLTHPLLDGSTAVTLTTTAVASGGTSPRPTTGRSRRSPDANRPPMPPVPARVSSSRAGVTPTKPSPEGSPVSNQPTTSATTSTVPAKLSSRTLPPAPTGASTKLGTISPAWKLRLDERG